MEMKGGVVLKVDGVVLQLGYHDLGYDNGIRVVNMCPKILLPTLFIFLL